MRGGGRYEKKENIKELAKKQIKQLTAIGNKFEDTYKEFSDYKQELVFKMKTSKG